MKTTNPMWTHSLKEAMKAQPCPLDSYSSLTEWAYLSTCNNENVSDNTNCSSANSSCVVLVPTLPGIQPGFDMPDDSDMDMGVYSGSGSDSSCDGFVPDNTRMWEFSEGLQLHKQFPQSTPTTATYTCPLTPPSTAFATPTTTTNTTTTVIDGAYIETFLREIDSKPVPLVYPSFAHMELFNEEESKEDENEEDADEDDEVDDDDDEEDDDSSDDNSNDDTDSNNNVVVVKDMVSVNANVVYDSDGDSGLMLDGEEPDDVFTNDAHANPLQITLPVFPVQHQSRTKQQQQHHHHHQQQHHHHHHQQQQQQQHHHQQQQKEQPPQRRGRGRPRGRPTKFIKTKMATAGRTSRTRTLKQQQSAKVGTKVARAPVSRGRKRSIESVTTSTFECLVCAKSFISRSKVTRHMLVHSGEKRHECNYCGARFGQKSAMHVHQRRKHADRLEEDGIECLQKRK